MLFSFLVQCNHNIIDTEKMRCATEHVEWRVYTSQLHSSVLSNKVYRRRASVTT